MTIGVIAWMKTSRPEFKSFWDLLRNPELLANFGEHQREIAERAGEVADSPEEIAKLVDEFVFEAPSQREAIVEKRVLQKLGPAIYPRMREILADESNRDRLVVLTEQIMALPEAPICRLCALFEQEALPPPGTLYLLVPFLKSDSREVRKAVALAIGSFGSDEAVRPLKIALQDPEEYVNSYALMGIQRAISANRVSDASRDAYYDMVANVWPEKASFPVDDDVPNLMLQLKPDAAISRLSQPDFLTADFEPAWRILEAFSERNVEISRARILELVRDASKEPIEYPKSALVEGALMILGKYRNDQDLPLLERMVDNPNRDVSKGAIQGLRAYHRRSEKVRDGWDIIATEGWEALTDVEKHIYAIRDLDDEVVNGGFAQYYFNSSGDQWNDALSGLKIIGATKRSAILEATVAKFGPVPPSADREERQAQLSKIVRKEEAPFQEQDSSWYGLEDEEPLEKLMFRYERTQTEDRAS